MFHCLPSPWTDFCPAHNKAVVGHCEVKLFFLLHWMCKCMFLFRMPFPLTSLCEYVHMRTYAYDKKYKLFCIDFSI